jgi:non-specific serine/threonine protein kinase
MSRTRPTQDVGNLGAEVTSFIGRRREVADVKRLLAVSRLVTLTGVGGVGKTRLARRVAADARRDFPDGVWFVDLAVLEVEGLLTQTVASALGLQDRGASWSVSVLGDFLRDKMVLLVLDSCEHLRDSCAVLVDALLRQAPGLSIITTSRQSLGLTGEHVYQVPPLSLPEDSEQVRSDAVAHYEAVNLFVERARAVRPTFDLTNDNVQALTAVCRRLDGIPLALELAAARLTALSVQELLERLEDRFQLLIGGSVAALPRHQTLRELIAWSWDLCVNEEQVLWARASVFPSAFDLESAEFICAGGVLEGHSVLDLLTALVGKTILTAHEESGRVRYRMLETLRHYGHGRLRETGDEETVRKRHQAYYCHLAVDAGERWFGPHQKDLLEQMRSEHSNIRTALETSFEDHTLVLSGLQMVSDLWFFWIATGQANEARRWLELGLHHALDPGPDRVRAIEACAYLAIMQEDFVAARVMLADANELVARQDDAENTARATQLAGTLTMFEGNPAGAKLLLEQALSEHRTNQDMSGLLDTSFSLAVIEAIQGNLDSAEALCLDAITICDTHREYWFKSYILCVLGFVELRRGNADDSTVRVQEALRLGQLLGEVWVIACCFEILAWASVSGGDARHAARLLGAAEAIWERTGKPFFGFHDLANYHETSVATLRERLGEQNLKLATAQGASMALDESVRYARLGTATSHSDSEQPQTLPSLTKRETEVAGLVAQGLTNKEIAARLVISQRTAEAHIERILSKLGFTSRSQVAAWVVQNQR